MLSLITNALLAALLTGNLGGVGWCKPSNNAERRVSQLQDVCEFLGFAKEDTWERWWQIDQPSPLTPVRVHGGIGP
jgi:hypothetical protein